MLFRNILGCGLAVLFQQPASAPLAANCAASYAPQGALAGMTNGVGIVTSNSYNDRLQPILMSASTGAGISTSISSASVPSTCQGQCVATYNVASSAGISVNDTITISGNSNSQLNGSATAETVADPLDGFTTSEIGC